MTEPTSRAALAPVTPARIEAARAFGIRNVEVAALACRKANLAFYAACALLEKETHGANVWGHDVGGYLSTKAGPVTTLDGQTYDRGANVPVSPGDFMAFLVKVMNGEVTSNGVGPCQITYAGSLKNGHRDGGYFRQMSERGLLPWKPLDNMVFGFGVLRGHYGAHGNSWVTAGRLYNGRLAYGEDLAEKVALWRARFREAK